MADDKTKPNLGDQEEVVSVPSKLLIKMQEDMAMMEQKIADNEAKSAGLEELFSKSAEAGTEPKLREKRDFTPKFRTVRIRKYAIAGDFENLGYVIGWTNRGAYEQVDNTGITKQIKNFMDIIFLGQEKTADGKIKTEKVEVLDLMNKGIQVHCKIVDEKREDKKVETGEVIDVSTYDPKHGLVDTGEQIDGWVAYSEIKYKIQIPGIVDPIWIDAEFLN
jgi:hypothetical protein